MDILLLSEVENLSQFFFYNYISVKMLKMKKKWEQIVWGNKLISLFLIFDHFDLDMAFCKNPSYPMFEDSTGGHNYPNLFICLLINGWTHFNFVHFHLHQLLVRVECVRYVSINSVATINTVMSPPPPLASLSLYVLTFFLEGLYLGFRILVQVLCVADALATITMLTLHITAIPRHITTLPGI